MMKRHTFAIGAVSRLVGLSTHALRKWEIRHGAIRPSRSDGGDRRYSKEDLERLEKLKHLVDLGHAIGSIAALTDPELDALRAASDGVEGQAEDVLSVAVLGERLSRELDAAAGRLPQIQVVLAAESVDELAAVQADAIIAEVPVLTEQTREDLRAIRKETGIDRLLVVYRYGSITFAENLSDPWTATLSRPINFRELVRALRSISADRFAPRVALGLPRHRFTRKQLSNIASMSPALACECPRHVAELIIELSDFEAYSESCEVNQPDDAIVHGMLRRTAATARSFFENALVDLAAYENLEIKDE